MSITVKGTPKPNPDCEYCMAAKEALKSGDHVLSTAIAKIKKQASEIKGLKECLK